MQLTEHRRIGLKSHLTSCIIDYCNVSEIQINLIITLSLGSKETDRVISEPCYNEVIYNRHKAK